MVCHKRLIVRYSMFANVRRSLIVRCSLRYCGDDDGVSC